MLLRSLGRLKLRIMARVRMNKSGKTRGYVTAASLSNQDDDKDKNVTSLHKSNEKQLVCTLCTDVKWPVLQLCARREHLTTILKCFSSHQSQDSSRPVLSKMTWNNWEFFAVTWSSIFRWRSRCQVDAVLARAFIWYFDAMYNVYWTVMRSIMIAWSTHSSFEVQ